MFPLNSNLFNLTTWVDFKCPNGMRIQWRFIWSFAPRIKIRLLSPLWFALKSFQSVFRDKRHPTFTLNGNIKSSNLLLFWFTVDWRTIKCLTRGRICNENQNRMEYKHLKYYITISLYFAFIGSWTFTIFGKLLSAVVDKSMGGIEKVPGWGFEVLPTDEFLEKAKQPFEVVV